MSKTAIITFRELKERFSSRSFIGMTILGPIVVLAVIYLFLSMTATEKATWKVLIMDKNELFENKLQPKEDPLFDVDFINAFVDYDEFAQNQQFEDYDLSVWINEKVVSNKNVIISYREQPSEYVQRRLQYIVERRLEEIMVQEFTDLKLQEFRAVKQPLQFTLKDANDPKNEKTTKNGWVGFSFGGLIVLFLLTFGMTILRGVAREKSNRIVELLLASVNPRQLLTGKVFGIGIAAIIQFVFWIVIIAVGFWAMRETLFPDLSHPELVADAAQQGVDEVDLYANQSPFVELLFDQIQYANMILFFVLFFLGGYLFYGAFFAMIGASAGSESDGQQFVIPMIILLLLALGSGYYAVMFPESTAVDILGFIPFTSPVVLMVDLAYGFADGEAWKLYFSLFILLLSALGVFALAARIYKNGLLHFGHRLRFGQIVKWLKN
ncbi:MAG: ABC transporter permease [Bacteroidota bacterium]